MIGHSKGMQQAQSLAADTTHNRAPATADAPEMARASGRVSPSFASVSGGNPPALSFAEVYEEHFDFAWRAARRLGVPPASLDDVVQDVFVTVYRRLGEFEGRSQLKTWVFGILRHTVRDLRRSRRRKPTETLEDEPRAVGCGPEEQAAREEGTKLLHQVLGALDDDQREVFVLAELEQMSAPEIASALEVNVNTVYSRLRAARLSFDAALRRLRSRDEWRMR